MSAQRIIIKKKCACAEQPCDKLGAAQKAEAERARQAELQKIKRELLTLARRVEELTTA